jgi:uracil-DNA glycosylase family 4
MGMNEVHSYYYYCNNDLINRLNQRIISCIKCSRLVQYREHIARMKVKRFKDWDYWGKPVPGFGDVNARLLIIGLAPAAHGANRTGRMFTGDSSGSWLIRALYDIGLANKPTSTSLDDGLLLKDVYVTAVLRCVPPGNKPLMQEIHNCMGYLREEISLLKNVRIVLTLGRVAFDTYARIINKDVEFKHGKLYELDNGIMLMASYHPSRQNTQTGRLTWDSWISIFKKIEEILLLINNH